jgi:mutator protein MutT
MKELTLVFLLKDKQVLLAMKKRGFGAGKWNGVGGKLEPGETVEQALIRECQEEIDVTLVTYYRAADIVFNEFVGGVSQQMRVHVFVCRDWDGEPVESEEMAPQWFNISNLPYESMWDDDQYWMPQLLNGNHVQAEFWLDETNTVTNYSLNVEVINKS